MLPSTLSMLVYTGLYVSICCAYVCLHVQYVCEGEFVCAYRCEHAMMCMQRSEGNPSPSTLRGDVEYARLAGLQAFLVFASQLLVGAL